MNEKHDIPELAWKRERPTFMVVDDNPFISGLIKLFLREYGDVVGVSKARDAMPRYSELDPDVIFLDIHMREISGFEILDQIRKQDAGSYIIMITGDASRDNMAIARKKGADGFLEKPLSKEKVLTILSQCPGVHT